MHTLATTLGLILAIAGFAISIAFWVPGLINKTQLKETMGGKYPLVYIIYLANGPGLMLLGLMLFSAFH